jgi:hypothetical protein
MIENIFNFFNQGWVGSLIGLVGIILGAIGIFSYKISRSTAKPSYQKYSLRLLGRDEDNLPNDVVVTFKGKEVERLTKTTIVLWNNGTEVLKGESVVGSSPIAASFPDDTNILSYKILKTTKEANNFNVSRSNDSSNTLQIEFSYLDPKDGAVIELLHDSKERYPVINGTIMGHPNGFEDLGKVATNRAVKAKYPLNIILGKPKLVLGAAIILGLGMTVIGLLPEELVKILIKEKEDKTLLDSQSFFIVMGLLYALLPASLLWMRRKRYPKNLDVEEVEP